MSTFAWVREEGKGEIMVTTPDRVDWFSCSKQLHVLVDPWASISYFQKGAPEQVEVHEGTWEGFWSMIAGEDHQRRNTTRNPIIQVFHSWMCKRILGRMRETKITNTELNWLYSALIAKWSIDLSYLMINRWCCGATLSSEILVRGVTSPCWLSL
jgi:hypothetical protein